jgi:hypothetical protein
VNPSIDRSEGEVVLKHPLRGLQLFSYHYRKFSRLTQVIAGEIYKQGENATDINTFISYVNKISAFDWLQSWVYITPSTS